MSWVLNDVSVPVWFLLLLFGGNFGAGVMQLRAARFRDAYRARTGADLPTVPEDADGRGLAEVAFMLAQFTVNVALLIGLALAAHDRLEVRWRGGVHVSTTHENTPHRSHHTPEQGVVTGRQESPALFGKAAR